MISPTDAAALCLHACGEDDAVLEAARMQFRAALAARLFLTDLRIRTPYDVYVAEWQGIAIEETLLAERDAYRGITYIRHQQGLTEEAITTEIEDLAQEVLD